MYTSTFEACSALVHKFEDNVCSILNSSETESPTHSHKYDNNEEERKEEQNNKMILSSDISTTSSKEQIETTMGNNILKTKSKITNFTELTDHQIEFLVASTKFSAQQVREWHQS